MNCTKKYIKSKDTELHFSFSDDISHSFGSELPYPQSHYLNHFNKIIYCWLIDGHFSTRKGITFLNDILARVKITFPYSQFIKRVEVESETSNAIQLKQFQNLKSRATSIINNQTRADATTDYVFYCIKIYAEELIKEKTIFTMQDLELFAELNFLDHCKDRSTLRAKCRNIWNWYFDRNFEISIRGYVKKDPGEVLKGQRERMSTINKAREENAKNRIIDILDKNKQRYIKSNGKINISLLCRENQISRKTFYKHFGALE